MRGSTRDNALWALSPRRHCQRQLERVEGVFKRLAERPLLSFGDHKQALDRCRPGLDLDDDLNIAVGRRRSGAWGAGVRASNAIWCNATRTCSSSSCSYSW
jgi:hypothetical protein